MPIIITTIVDKRNGKGKFTNVKEGNTYDGDWKEGTKHCYIIALTN